MSVLCSLSLSSTVYAQQTLDQGIDIQLSNDCDVLKGTTPSATDFFGPQLKGICTPAGPGGGGGFSAGGGAATSQTRPIYVLRRLEDLRDAANEGEPHASLGEFTVIKTAKGFSNLLDLFSGSDSGAIHNSWSTFVQSSSIDFRKPRTGERSLITNSFIASGSELSIPQIGPGDNIFGLTETPYQSYAMREDLILEESRLYQSNVGAAVENPTNAPIMLAAAPSEGTSANHLYQIEDMLLYQGNVDATAEKKPVATTTEPPRRLSLFIAGDFEWLDRNRTTYEDGYDSNIWGITAGGDYRFTDWLIAGLALNYSHWSGDFQGGGDFDIDSYGSFAYASISPVERFYTQAVLGYARKEYDRSRVAIWEDTTVAKGPVDGINSADYGAEEFSAAVVANYDFPIGRFTIGPRGGLSYVRTNYDSFEESSSALVANPALNIIQGGPTGIALAFDEDSRTSLQSIIGVGATAVYPVSGAIIVPQVSFDWRHEFKDDQRAIGVQFVQDFRSTPTQFSYLTDPPDRDFFVLSLGGAVLFDNGLESFVAVRTLLGQEYYESTVINFGLRMGF